MVTTARRRNKEGMTRENGECWRCGLGIGGAERIGRRAACAGCGAELRCCLNCRFHTPGVHNECQEPQAERQVDRARGNFCEYFAAAAPRAAPGVGVAPTTRAELDALFAKRRG